MQRTDLDKLSEEVLTQLEKEENTLLSWGITGGTFDAIEKVEIIINTPPTELIEDLWTKLEEQGETIDSIVENLVNRKLLFNGKIGYRSRYAETIRLLYLLKQRFKCEDWLNAPNLVSNVKTNLLYRNYPKRNFHWNELRIVLKREQTPDFVLLTLDQLLEHGNLQLSGFQVESLSHLLKQGKKSADGGTIIGAGTGSGKTKAFYLPAFGQIAQSIKEDDRFWTRMLGIYPRTELLKDQFGEALSEGLKLNELFDSHSVRRITIGSFYGDTPYMAEDVKFDKNRKWKTGKGGYICPSLVCPTCSSDMIWKEDDLHKAISTKDYYYERLHCSGCNLTIEATNIVLTRKRMLIEQPDILFTTTEMLNRKLSSGIDQHIFGVRGDRKPPLFVLLDEVHIYNGINGAHVAYLLRRWHSLVKNYSRSFGSIQFVGLSATLPNPQHFFSQLIGIQENRCKYITPNPDDMTDEGMEYNLVLRGDPFSSAALLSTSVQTVMLLGRMLDPLSSPVSKGAYGSKIFGFTDKLDVINRWFHIEKDAEERQVLSQYRDWDVIKEKAPALVSTRESQSNTGQIWALAKQIDPLGLQNSMKIDITSSQYKGVDAKAKFVVATSTLEVGYNDPQVGAVIQHKAPRNLASFLQRKGRAGRSRGMRPWTIVVTSAYGRDRYVYDYPEQLFSPNLPGLTLPIRNVYVQRIQAGFAVMDWFACQLKQNSIKTPIWNVLSAKYNKFKDERRVLAECVYDVLNENDTELIAYIQSALQINGAALDRLLWTSPRSVMLDLLPSILNNLTMDWGRASISKEHLPQSPLQGYVPRNLFSSLEVNELHLVIDNNEKNEHYQSLQQGIMEFAPGNVSKRYAKAHQTREAHWLPLDLSNEEGKISVTDGPIIGKIIKYIKHKDEDIAVYLPQQYKLAQIPNEISDRSSGVMEWNVEIIPRNDSSEPVGTEIKLLSDSALTSFFKDIYIFTSNEHQTVTFTRYAEEVKSEIKYKNGHSIRRTSSFKEGENSSAIGFQVEVDALLFNMSPIALENVRNNENWEKLLSELRPIFYLDTLKQDSMLNSYLSVFEIEWLWEICLSSTVATAVSKQLNISEAVSYYRKNIKAITIRALDVIFQSTVVNMEEDVEQTENSKLHKRLLSHIETVETMNRFISPLDLLYKDISEYETFYPWIEKRLEATLAASIQHAIEKIVPDVNTEDLVIDIKNNKIWFSETDSGGIGIISSIASAIRNEPRLFEELFTNAVEECPRSDLAKSLSAITKELYDAELSETFRVIRKSSNLDEQKEQLGILQKQLSERGITPKRELIVSLTTKLLKRNSNEMTDELLRDLQNLWKSEEERLGCKIDMRVFTVACLRLDDFQDRINTILVNLYPGASGYFTEKQRFLLIESLLWSDCNDSCPECLNLYSSFQTFLKPSRLLLSSLLIPTNITINFNESNWEERFVATLKKGKQTRVKTSFQNMEKCQQRLMDIIQTPIDFEYEFYYPYIAGVHNSGTSWLFDVRVREVTHA